MDPHFFTFYTGTFALQRPKYLHIRSSISGRVGRVGGHWPWVGPPVSDKICAHVLPLLHVVIRLVEVIVRPLITLVDSSSHVTIKM